MKKLNDAQKDFMWSILLEDLFPKWNQEYKEQRKKEGYYDWDDDQTLSYALRADDRLYQYAELMVRLEVITKERLDEIVCGGW